MSIDEAERNSALCERYFGSHSSLGNGKPAAAVNYKGVARKWDGKALNISPCDDNGVFRENTREFVYARTAELEVKRHFNLFGFSLTFLAFAPRNISHVDVCT